MHSRWFSKNLPSKPAGDDEDFPRAVVVVAGDEFSCQARPVIGCLAKEPRVRTCRENVGMCSCMQTTAVVGRGGGRMIP